MLKPASVLVAALTTAATALAPVPAWPSEGAPVTPEARPSLQQPRSETAATSRARQAVAAHPQAARVADEETLRALNVVSDSDGTAHVRFARTYKDVPVIGGHLIVHNASGQEAPSFTVDIAQPIDISIDPDIPEGEATARARERFRGAIQRVAAPRLVIEPATARD